MRGPMAEWLWQFRLKCGGRPLTQPGCSRCGYPIQGLTGSICPECGADHRIVGISHPLPPLSARTMRRLSLLLWTLLVPGLALLLNPILLPLTPRDLSNHRDYALTFTGSANLRGNIRQIGYGWGWKAAPWIPGRPRSVLITVTELFDLPDHSAMNTRQGQMTIGPDGSTEAIAFAYDSTSPKGRKIYESKEAFAPETVRRWFGLISPDTPLDLVREQSGDLHTLATPRAFADPLPPVGHLQITSVTGGPEIAPAYHGRPWVIAFWIVIYLIGCLILAWINRSKRELDVLPLKPLRS